MTTMNPKQSRMLAVGLLLILILIVVDFIIVPVVSRFMDYGDRIEALENQLAIYRRLSAGLDEDEKKLADLKAAAPVTDLYLSQSKPALAAADLQQYFHQQVARSGSAQVISTQILNRDEKDPLQAVSIQVHLRGELEDLVNLLYNLESGKPALFVENMTVLANPRRQIRVPRRAGRRVQVQSIPALDVRFDLTGYATKEGAK